MTRLRGWEDRLVDVVTKHTALPAAYGVSDCYLIADDGVEACLGMRMHAHGTYSTAAGAAKRLREHGFATVEDAFRARFAEIPPSLAQRGDIGVTDQEGQPTGGLFTQLGFFTRGEHDTLYLPASAVRAAFRVV